MTNGNDFLIKHGLSGVVVLYNPDRNVINNIASYINYLSHLYVIDNSESSDHELIRLIGEINNNISYHCRGENSGIAKALNQGCSLAYNDGYKWILTMDQDSSIKSNFFNIIQPLLSSTKIIIIAASYDNIFYKPRKSEHPGFVEIGTVITSGNLLNLVAWKSLDGFCEKLFIDEVDNEFCIRAVKAGFKILSTDSVYLSHNLGTKYSKTNILTHRSLNFTKHSPTRLYYMTRNNLFLWKKYLLIDPCLIYNRMRNLFKLIYEITFYYPDKLSYYKNIVKGAFHFFISKYGKM
jgi:rhamnosyltransferase